MKPLSAYTYIRNNLKKVFPSFISITLGVFLVYLLSLLLYSSVLGINLVGLNLTERGTLLSSNTPQGFSEEIMNKLEKGIADKSVLPVIPNVGSFMYSSPFGDMSGESYTVYPEDLSRLMEFLDLTLVEGALPGENEGEVLVPLRFAKQNNVEIGDLIGKNLDINADLHKEYRICGLTDGPVMVFLASDTDSMGRDEAAKHSVLISVRANPELSQAMGDLEDKSVSVIDRQSIGEEMGQIQATYNSLSFSLDFLIILVLCISIGNLNYISFLNRKHEYAVLAAIGYRKSFLYLKLLKENLVTCLLGFGAGIAFTILVVELLNQAVWLPQGKYVSSFEPRYIIVALVVPAVVSVASMLSSLRELRKINHESLKI